MKKLLAFILALGMVLALAACSGKDGQPASLSSASWEEIVDAAKGMLAVGQQLLRAGGGLRRDGAVVI